MMVASDLVFNPGDPDFIRDPYPTYHRFQKEDPLHHMPSGFWLATRYADVAAILKDRRFGRDWGAAMALFYGPAWAVEPIWQYSVRTMLFMNAPEHTRVRSLFTKAFSARRVMDTRPTIERIANDLIDRVEARGHMDVCEDFASPLPIRVICEMTGVPAQEVGHITGLVKALLMSFETRPLTRAELDACNNALKVMEEYFTQLVVQRKAEPRDDLLTGLIMAEEDGHKLTVQELVWNLIQTFAAGFETTAGMIGNALLALHRQPEQLAYLKSLPKISPNEIEELFRYDISTQLGGRTAMVDIEMNGAHIKAGDTIFLALGGANRDPEAFPHPDRLDFTRKDIRTLTFGGGIHYCLGAQLARIEGEVAFNTLLRRLPDLELDDIENPAWRPTATIRALETLPAHWPGSRKS